MDLGGGGIKGKNGMKQEKGLLGEALNLTFGGGDKKCVFVKTTSIHYFMPPLSPSENPGSTTDHLPHVSYSRYVLPPC